MVEAEDAPGGAGPVPGAAARPAGGRHAATGPVFVDGSGRRLRAVRRFGWVMAVPAAGYAALLVSSALGGPTVSTPYLPLPEQPRTHGHGTGPAGPAADAASRTPAASAIPTPASASRPRAGTTRPVATAPGATTAPAAGPSAGTSATPSASPTPTATHGRSGSHPTPSHTARGHV